MQNIISHLQSSITIWYIILLIGVGLFELFYDGHVLRREGLTRESSIAKMIGVAYIMIGILVYGFVKLI